MIEEVLRENVGSLLPVITEFEEPFWHSLAGEKLLVQKCSDCGHVQFPPSPVCTNCLSDKVRWEECSGKASLWSKVRFHKAYLEPYADVPYAVGIAKLEDGCLISGRISNDVYDKLPLDTPVKVEFRKTKDSTVIIEFVPAED